MRAKSANSGIAARRAVQALGAVLVAVALLSTGGAALEADKESTPQTRTLTGQVFAKGDSPVADAVVYLKNSKTQTVKTYIADENGAYRFLGLSPNVDYEVYAEYQGRRSETRTLSSFDSRMKVTIHLRIDLKR